MKRSEFNKIIKDFADHEEFYDAAIRSLIDMAFGENATKAMNIYEGYLDSYDYNQCYFHAESVRNNIEIDKVKHKEWIEKQSKDKKGNTNL